MNRLFDFPQTVIVYTLLVLLHSLEALGCKESLENLVLTGKIEGRRSRGRRIFWMDSLQKCLEERGVKDKGMELIEKAKN